MILRVAKALRGSGVCPVIAVAYTRATKSILSLPWEELHASVVFIETPGAGFPQDLPRALRDLPQPTLVVPVDLPHLTPGLVARAARDLCGRPWDVVNLAGPRGLTGVSLHRRWDGSGVWGNVRLEGVEDWRLLDVDTPGDLEEARGRCGGRGGTGETPPGE